jgi:hypothetical protein
MGMIARRPIRTENRTVPLKRFERVLGALEDLYEMVCKNPAPAIKADERFVKAGVVLGENGRR